jgi:hypothetical protein
MLLDAEVCQQVAEWLGHPPQPPELEREDRPPHCPFVACPRTHPRQCHRPATMPAQWTGRLRGHAAMPTARAKRRLWHLNAAAALRAQDRSGFTAARAPWRKDEVEKPHRRNHHYSILSLSSNPLPFPPDRYSCICGWSRQDGCVRHIGLAVKTAPLRPAATKSAQADSGQAEA